MWKAQGLSKKLAIDMTFGDGGIATFLNPQYAMRGTSVAIQADGRIIVAGWADTNPSNFLLARLTTTGTLDPTFSGDGFVTTDFDAGNDYATAVPIQPDGKIVAAGWGGIGTDDDFVAVRYNVDGTLDTAFGGDGKVTIGFGDYDTSYDATLQDDGKLVLVGGNFEDFAVARLNTDGTLDNSFDGTANLPLVWVTPMNTPARSP